MNYYDELIKCFEDITKTAGQVGYVLGSALLTFSKTLYQLTQPIINEFNITLYSYPATVEKIDWPIYLVFDDDFQHTIMDIYNSEKDFDKIETYIFDYFNDNKLKELENEWLSCNNVAEGRKNILSEVIKMHEQGNYYSSVSIMMCQVSGVATDIIKFANCNNLELSEESKKRVLERYKIEKDYSEKGKVAQMLLLTENNAGLWVGATNYLMEKVLVSPKTKDEWPKAPLRNKICHGEQLDFGTKEYSLKSILIIDMLIKLLYELEEVSKIRKDADNTGVE